MSDDEDNHATSGSIASTAELGVSEASLELAERVALRLDIYDKPAIFNMLSSRAKLGAGIVTVSFLFWWLLISNSSSDNLDIGVSKFFALDFNQVALAVMALAFLHSAFGDFGREMGSLVPSLISGVMIIMVGHVQASRVSFMKGGYHSIGDSSSTSLGGVSTMSSFASRKRRSQRRRYASTIRWPPTTVPAPTRARRALLHKPVLSSIESDINAVTTGSPT